MLEFPEAAVIARQIRETLTGRKITAVIANQSPHKFGWFTGDPASYPALLKGKTLQGAEAFGGMVEVAAGDHTLAFTTNMRYYPAGEKRPPKHQLLLEFDDGSAFCASVQMWGAMMCRPKGVKYDFIDLDGAKEKPSPLTAAFDRHYFDSLANEATNKLSTKAFLATEQRIPGLGNGVLQDILWSARIHPKRKMSSIRSEEMDALFAAVKKVLRSMVDGGGRDTESDLFGRPGGYVTVLSKNTAGRPCPLCGSIRQKEAYMGGSIYYCPGCQPL